MHAPCLTPTCMLKIFCPSPWGARWGVDQSSCDAHHDVSNFLRDPWGCSVRNYTARGGVHAPHLAHRTSVISLHTSHGRNVTPSNPPTSNSSSLEIMSWHRLRLDIYHIASLFFTLGFYWLSCSNGSNLPRNRSSTFVIHFPALRNIKIRVVVMKLQLFARERT